MAANMPPQMGGRPPLGRPAQQQLSRVIYDNLMANNVQATGWQSTVNIAQRLTTLMQMISTSFLAMPHMETNQLINIGLNYEREAFLHSPDKIGIRMQEFNRRRQANEQNMQNSLNAQAAAQAQAQAQMMNPQNGLQMSRGMGQTSQQGFQHLQQPMQASPMTQQNPQPNMGMMNNGLQAMNPNQQPIQAGPSQMRPQLPLVAAMANLSPQDRAKVQQLAMQKLAHTPEPQRNSIRMMLNNKAPQQMAQMQQENIDPVLYFYQQQIISNARTSNQAAMQMQHQQQQRPMSTAGQPLGAVPNGEMGQFANVESIVNQQKAGYMAQEAGQMVVPASSGPGRNATPQPMAGGQVQNPGNNQAGPGQPGRPHPGQQPFNLQQAQQMKMDQAAQQSQAQIRAQAQAKQMQGQPGGFNGGPGPVSQSPGMNTLNAPVRRTPVSAGQVESQSHMGQVSAPFGQMLDPRFNQGYPRPQMGVNGNIDRQQILQHILASVPAEKRQQLMSLAPEKLNEMITNWQAAQAAHQAGRAPAQMTGRAQPPQQPGQLGQGNPLAQFAPGNSGMGQRPNMGMPMNPQNQMLLRQQIQRTRSNVPGQNVPPNVLALMDSMDVPQKIMDGLRGQGHPLPPEMKKWGQFKQWLNQRNMPTQLIANLVNVQRSQFETILKRNPSLGAATGQVPQPNGPQGPQLMNAHVPARPGQIPGGIPGFVDPVVTTQELEAAKNHEKFRNQPDDRIKSILYQMKLGQMHQQQRKAQMAGAQMQAPPTSQGPPMNMTAPAQAQNGPNPSQRPQNVGPDVNATGPATNARNNRPKQNNRQSQNVSPAIPPRTGVKRPSTDDVVEVPNPAAAQATRPPSQQSQPAAAPPSLPQLNPQQLANLPPEQRAKYEAMLRHRQQPQPEDIDRLKTIGQEERRAAQHEQVEDIPMTPEQLKEMAQKIRHMTNEVNKLGKVLGRWYSLTHDDSRARMFFKMRLKLIRQFQDAEKMTILKDSFSMRPQEVDGARSMLESMAKDLAASYPQGMRRNTSQQNSAETTAQAGAGDPKAAMPQPAPLNAANLEKQNQQAQAVKMHQRSASKGGQVPPAPTTTTQPPFPFGAPSPAGQPTYFGKNTITQSDLALPARKRPKTGTHSGTGSANQSANASPQVPKQPSPEMARRAVPDVKAPPKPQFICPEPGCEANSIGFPTEEARRNHHEEEHVKPYQDPEKFVKESLAAALGLDPNGNPTAQRRAQGAGASGHSPAPPVTNDPSKHGQTPVARNEATPMSRESSTKRRPGVAGSNGSDFARNTGGKVAASNSPSMSKVMDGTGKPDEIAGMQAPLIDSTWTATIDPQDLFQAMGALETGGNGAISDMNVYRAISPNDTPESSKDGSEPNSDVSEGVSLNVSLDMGFGSWRPFEGDQLHNFGSAEVGIADLSDQGQLFESVFAESISWDEVNSDFSKPFSLDTSLYSMDTT
ncbi:hypothetical protein DL770_008248 [Monosporascus sp. CRB-9-2]|nr:hypothetical protein DL770_008248 [Monosporascus sp. CRB-9-2]